MPLTDPAFTARAYLLPDLLTPVAWLDNLVDYGWQEQLSDAGSGTIKLQKDDPQLAVITMPLTVVNFYVHGLLAVTFWPEFRDKNLIATDEEPEEHATFIGRLTGGMLDYVGLWPSGGVGRTPIQEDRNFNYIDQAYDDSGWSNATEITDVATAKTSWAGGAYLWGADFPDDTAKVIGPSSGTIDLAPVGDIYTREFLAAPSDGPYNFYVGIDNYGEANVDGAVHQNPGESGDLWVGFSRTTKIPLELTAGSHLFTVKATNGPGSPGDFNPVGVAYALYSADSAGNDVALIAHSTSAAKIMEYPSETPGMTPGEALFVWFAEAQARAVGDPLAIINLLTTSFTASVDTDGTSWPSTADIATKVGRTLLGFLREMSETFIDWRLRPGCDGSGFMVLDVWVKDGRGSAVAVDYHSPTDDTDESTGNLVAHHEKAEG